MDAFKAGQHFEKVFIKSGLKGHFVEELYDYCNERAVPLKKVPLIKLDQLSRRRNHQGTVGIMAAVEYQNIRDILPLIFEKGETPNLLILEGITDVRNVGAIARSAEVLGVHAIIFPLSNSAEINEDAIKTSAGALMTIPICREKDLGKTINYLKESGIHIICSSLDGDKNIFDVDMTGPLATVIGSEHSGVSQDLINRSDGAFKIPQVGGTDSLNVSVAAGIILYECLKQRSKLEK